MKLTFMDCHDTQVSDLSPLKGMRLNVHKCRNAHVTDLSLLKDMQLQILECDFRPDRDTEILRSIPTLKNINFKPAKDFWKEVAEKKQDKKP